MFLAPIGGARAGEAALPSTAEICAAVKPLGERVDRIAHRRLEAEYVDPEGEEAASRNYALAQYLCAHPGKSIAEGLKAVLFPGLAELEKAERTAPSAVSPPSNSAMDKAKLDALINKNAPFASGPDATTAAVAKPVAKCWKANPYAFCP
jgi:hypothetical protein